MQHQRETQPILHSNSPNNNSNQQNSFNYNNNTNNKSINNKSTKMATQGQMAATPNSGTGHSHLQKGHTSNPTGSQSSAAHRHHGKPTTPRTDQSEKANIRILQEVLQKGCESGTVEKKQLPPAICRVEGMKLWREVLNTNVYNGIVKLKLRWCAIQSQGAKLLADGLGNSCMQSLEVLDLMGNEIGVSGTRAIASLLAPGIDLDSFQVQDARSVLAAFENTTRIGCLKTLVLSYNCTSDAGCGYLGKSICISNTINRLELENCEIGDNGCKYLRRGIERNSTIRTLNIAANRYGDLGAREIQSFLLRNSSLEKLDISRNRLGPQRTMEIAKGLTMNRSLKVLRMNINRIGARGAQLLAKMLINNHTLQELELSYNEIFNDGVQVLAQGLVQNHGLRRLVLWYNGLEDAAARQLARALHQRSKAPHFRNDMVQAVAESQPDYFFINDRSGKPRPHPETYPICEKIVDFVPIFMYFEVDLTHNRRITKNGINALLEVANSETIAVRGLNELLAKDRRERESAALAKTSLY